MKAKIKNDTIAIFAELKKSQNFCIKSFLKNVKYFEKLNI